MLNELYTKQGQALAGTPWDVYPRPQMRRENWLNLNGAWEFAPGKRVYEGKTIQVPFCPESRLSGIGTHYPEGTEFNHILFMLNGGYPSSAAFAEGTSLIWLDEYCIPYSKHADIYPHEIVHALDYSLLNMDLIEPLVPSAWMERFLRSKAPWIQFRFWSTSSWICVSS